MKILVYSHRMDYTGAPLILFRLMKHLARRHEITVLLPSHVGKDGPLRAEFEAAGIATREVVRISAFDLLVANTLIAHPVLVNVNRRCRALWWIHEPEDGLSWLRNGHVDPKAFQYCNRVVFPTRWQYEALYKPYVGDLPVGIVPYGIGIDPFDGPPPFARERPDDLHLVHLGWYAKRKGQDLVIRALEHLANPRIFCTFMGSPINRPEFHAELQAHVRGHPILSRTVTMLGEQPPSVAQAWVAHADALVFPTRADLITLTILEAMLNATCVLASDYGPIPETVVHGESGLLSPVDDHKVLADNIARIFADRALAGRLGAAGHAAYRAKHDFAAHLAGMEEQLLLAAEGR